MEELEKIDDDCDKHGIQFVKTDDKAAAKEHGVKEVSVEGDVGIINILTLCLSISFRFFSIFFAHARISFPLLFSSTNTSRLFTKVT